MSLTVREPRLTEKMKRRCVPNSHRATRVLALQQQMLRAAIETLEQQRFDTGMLDSDKSGPEAFLCYLVPWSRVRAGADFRVDDLPSAIISSHRQRLGGGLLLYLLWEEWPE